MVETAFSFADLLTGKARVTQETKVLRTARQHKTVERRRMQSPIMRRMPFFRRDFAALLETLQKGGGLVEERDLEILPGFPLEAFLQGPDSAAWNRDTCRSYRRALYELQHFLAGKGLPTPQLLEAWQADLHRQGYRQRSVNMRISAANNYFRRCGRHDLLMHHSRPNAVPVPELTRAEYLRLLQTARGQNKHRLYLLIKLFATTDLPLQCLEQITVQVVQDGGAMLDCRGSPLEFHLPAALRQELLDYIAEHGPASGPVFITRGGRPINRSNLCREMQELCRAAGVPEQKGSPRCLRNLYQATQNDIYANLEQMLQQAYDQLLQAEQTAAGWKEGA